MAINLKEHVKITDEAKLPEKMASIPEFGKSEDGFLVGILENRRVRFYRDAKELGDLILQMTVTASAAERIEPEDEEEEKESEGLIEKAKHMAAGVVEKVHSKEPDQQPEETPSDEPEEVVVQPSSEPNEEPAEAETLTDQKDTEPESELKITSVELQRLIKEAVQQATEPLNQRIEELNNQIKAVTAKNAELEAKIAELEGKQPPPSESASNSPEQKSAQDIKAQIKQELGGNTYIPEDGEAVLITSQKGENDRGWIMLGDSFKQNSIWMVRLKHRDLRLELERPLLSVRPDVGNSETTSAPDPAILKFWKQQEGKLVAHKEARVISNDWTLANVQDDGKAFLTRDNERETATTTTDELEETRAELQQLQEAQKSDKSKPRQWWDKIAGRYYNGTTNLLSRRIEKRNGKSVVVTEEELPPGVEYVPEKKSGLAAGIALGAVAVGASVLITWLIMRGHDPSTFKGAVNHHDELDVARHKADIEAIGGVNQHVTNVGNEFRGHVHNITQELNHIKQTGIHDHNHTMKAFHGLREHVDYQHAQDMKRFHDLQQHVQHLESIEAHENMGSGGYSTSTGGAESTPAVSGNTTGYRTPWDWAEGKYGKGNGSQAIFTLVERARAAGNNITWHNIVNGRFERAWLDVNGQTNSNYVIGVLSKY